jgi:uncharacterized membrane protein
MSPVTSGVPSRTTSRLSAIDALRGVVLAVMALDHVRDFFHAEAMVFRPEELTRTTAALFLTRWITHFCAPVFFFLAGASAFLWMSREGRTVAALSRYLWTRGLWLIVLELTALRFGFFFSLRNGPLLLTVLWALGLSMIALSVLCRLPVRRLALLSGLVIALHNLLDPIEARQLGALAFAWNVLHQPGVFFAFGMPVVVAYPLIPWLAVMSAGYAFAAWYLPRTDASTDLGAIRRVPAWRWGAALTLAFVVLRAINLYGDPARWSTAVPNTAVLSFLNTTKYPPSLLFVLMTLGPALMVLAWLQRRQPSPDHPIVVIGRVPLFFFLVHFLLAHALAIPFALITYGRAGFLMQPMPSMGGAADLYPPGFGYSLPTVYLVWMTVLALTYPLCAWFSRLKQRRRDWWLAYL